MTIPTTQKVKLVRQAYKDRRTGGTKLSTTLYLQYSHNGKQVRESIGTSDPTVAEKLRRKREAQLTLGGQEIESPRAQRTTFEDLANRLLVHYDNNELRSKDRVEDALDHLRPTFGGQRATAITSDRIANYIACRRKAGAAPATINQELACVRRMFSLGERDGLVLKRPHVDLLRTNNARKGFFEVDEYQAVRRHLPAALQPLVDVAYLTGWRIKSELLPLTWAQVDFGAGWIRLEPNTTKNAEGRQFPLLPALRQVLEQQRAHTEQVQRSTGRIIPHVFHRHGKRIGHFRRAWKTACLAAGLARLISTKPRVIKVHRIPHDFRRTAVRNLERAGISRSSAMKMVGHKSESVYRRYAIVSEGDLRAAGDKLAMLHGADTNRAVASNKVRPVR